MARRGRARASLLALSALLAGCAAGGDRAEQYAEAGRGLDGGVRLKRGAQPLVGGAAYCTRPATVAIDRVRAATAEAEEIRRDGVRAGSARYELLQSRMHRRIVRVCREVALAEGHDLIVRDGDIVDARGCEVVDLTDAVIAALRDGD